MLRASWDILDAQGMVRDRGCSGHGARSWMLRAWYEIVDARGMVQDGGCSGHHAGLWMLRASCEMVDAQGMVREVMAEKIYEHTGQRPHSVSS